MKLGNQAVTVTTRSRNLIPFPYNGSITTKEDFITISPNGVITVNGTSTALGNFFVTRQKILEAGKTYTLSGGKDNKICYLGITIYKTVGSQTLYDYGSGVTFTVPEDYTDYSIGVYTKVGTKFDYVTLKPMLNEGDTALPFEPYIQRHDLRVMQNLIDVDKLVGNALTKNDDGSYTITKNGTNRFSKIYNCDLSAGKYIFLADVLETTISRIYKISITIRYKDGKTSYPNFYPGSESKNVAFQLIKGVESIQFYQQPTELDGAYTKFKNLRLYRLA